jgi:photosystem II stability/assembly factor-like uncharacterized protein
MPLKTQAAAEFTTTHKAHFQGIFTAPQRKERISHHTKKGCFGVLSFALVTPPTIVLRGPSGSRFLKELPLSAHYDLKCIAS